MTDEKCSHPETEVIPVFHWHRDGCCGTDPADEPRMDYSEMVFCQHCNEHFNRVYR